MIKRYEELMTEMRENLAYLDRYGVPYLPAEIGFERQRPDDLEEQLEILNKEMDACRACHLASERFRRRGKCVPGGGNCDAIVMVVGEGPGKMEEGYKGDECSKEYGFPFVGPSGQLLNKMLRLVGLKREEVYMSNVTHCRAWEVDFDSRRVMDRAPSPQEVSHCLPFVRKQIRLIQPWLIITAGGSSGPTLLDKPLGTKISEIKDQLFDYPEDPRIKVWPMYHPAYLLRNESDRISAGLMLKHLRAIVGRAKKKLKEARQSPT